MENLLQEKFNDWGYVILRPGEEPACANTTFPDVWHHTYFKNQFYRIDPVFAFAAQAGRRSGVKLLTPTEMNSDLFEEAELYRADSNVVCVSFFGGNRMILGAVNHELDDRATPDCLSVAQRQHRLELTRNLELLTEPQADLLELAEEGLKDKEIAAEFGISLSAVAQRKKVICDKVGVSNFTATLQLYSLAKWGGIVGNI